MTIRKALALLVALSLAGLPLQAEDGSLDAALSPGQRIRFETTTIGLRYATVVETDGGELVLRLVNLDGTDRIVRVALSDVRSLEVAAGKRSRASEGATVGFAMGALTGGALGSLACGPDPEEPCQPLLGAALGAFVVGWIGAMIGGGIGATIKTDRWEKVGTTPQARLQLAPAKGGGLAVGLTVSF